MGQFISMDDTKPDDHKSKDSDFCPTYVNRYPSDMNARWRTLSRLFDTRADQKPLKVKTKQTATKRKFLEPLFGVMTDYVNRNTHLHTMLEALDKAAAETNQLLKTRTIAARAKQADGSLGPRKRYRMELRVVLKGGNLLRLYQLLYQHVMPLYFFKEMERDYMEFFKKGDLDVEFVLVNRDDRQEMLYIDPDDAEGRKALQILTYNTLNTYRNLMFKDNKAFRHLTFCGHGAKSPFTRHSLDELLNELRAAQPDLLDTEEEALYKKAKLEGIVIGNVVYGVDATTFWQDLEASVASGTMPEKNQRQAEKLLNGQGASRVDLYTELDDKDPLTRRFFALTKPPGSNLFITVHRQLRFVEKAPEGGDLLKDFMLGRIMLNSVLLFRDTQNLLIPINVRGEIIDFATSYSDDIKLKFKKKFISLKPFGMRYMDMFDGSTLRADLYSMLFKEVAYPWEDKKYAKRLVRMLFFQWLEIADNVRPIAKLIGTLALSKPITAQNYKTHPFMVRNDLMLHTDAPKQRQAFSGFLEVVNEFRDKLHTMLTTHEERKDSPLKREDMLEALAMRKDKTNV